MQPEGDCHATSEKIVGNCHALVLELFIRMYLLKLPSGTNHLVSYTQLFTKNRYELALDQ